MKIKNNTSHTLVTPNEPLLSNFMDTFKLQYHTIKNNHLLVDLTSLEPIKAKELNKLVKWASQSRSLKKSFIVIVKNISVDDVSEQLICVPTLLEAKDTLEMEEMERDLGF